MSERAAKVTVIGAPSSNKSKCDSSMGKRLRVAAYARVSSDHESQDSSFDAQRIYYEDMIRSKGIWDFVKIYADDGVSGTSIKGRYGFNEMIKDGLDGKIDLILTKSISRFARNTVDSLVALRKLQTRKVDVYFEEQGIHSMDMAGEIMITVFSALAQEESRTMSENIKWGYRRRFEQMKPLLGNLYGYNRISNGIYEIDDEKSEAVKTIYRQFLSGQSLYEICDYMNKNYPKENRWNAEHIRRILCNEKYSGNAKQLKTYKDSIFDKQRKPNNGQHVSYYIEQGHPAIVTEGIYARAQEEFIRREEASIRSASENTRIDKAKGYSGKYALSNVLVCDECGSPYRRQIWTARGNVRAVWRCSRRLKTGKTNCPNSPTLREDDIQQRIVNAFNQIIENRDEQERRLKDEVMKHSVFKEIEEEIQNKQIELENLNQQYKLAIELYQNNHDEEDQATLINIENRIHSCEGRVNELKDKKAFAKNDELRMKELNELFKNVKYQLLEYNDVLVNQLIIQIRIQSSGKILIEFKSGYTVLI